MEKENGKNLLAVQIYKDSCKRIANIVNEQLFDSCREWSWVCDEVGGLCDFEDTDAISIEDMVCIVENGVDYDEYVEWREANLNNNRYIDLRSWLIGARHEMFKEDIKPILDCCCGSRMFYFDKKRPKCIICRH